MTLKFNEVSKVRSALTPASAAKHLLAEIDALRDRSISMRTFADDVDSVLMDCEDVICDLTAFLKDAEADAKEWRDAYLDLSEGRLL